MPDPDKAAISYLIASGAACVAGKLGASPAMKALISWTRCNRQRPAMVSR
jgi:hypothetical protein